jgi:Trk K+ transport system NAD-binding subunit
VTSDDFTNIETALTVRSVLGGDLGEIPLALRVLDRNLAGKVQRNFGFHNVFSTAALAAPWFVGAALGLEVVATFSVERQPFLVGRLEVAEAGGLAGIAMQDLLADTRVICLRRGGQDGAFEYPPRRDTLFAGGDRAYVLGSDEDILRVLRQDQRHLGEARLVGD